MLLDASFARELEALRKRLRVRARSGGGGDHTAKRRGSSAEFLEHRPYAPGDDLRRIDWLAFARTGEPVFKLFRAEEDVIVRLVVDASASLGESAGEPNKLDMAKRIAAAIGYMALADSERAQVMAASEGLSFVSEPSRGRNALPKLLRDLDRVDGSAAGGTSRTPKDVKSGTDLSRAIEQVIVRSSRPGMLVIISDFMDAGPFDAAITHAAAAGHDIALVQVLSREEVEPQWDGDYALVDVESNATVEVTMDAGALEAYLARLNQLVLGLRALAKKVQGTYVRIVTDEPLLPVVRRFVGRVVD
jgi:uncharacterized protein (DUF58 family)